MFIVQDPPALYPIIFCLFLQKKRAKKKVLSYLFRTTELSVHTSVFYPVTSRMYFLFFLFAKCGENSCTDSKHCHECDDSDHPALCHCNCQHIHFPPLLFSLCFFEQFADKITGDRDSKYHKCTFQNNMSYHLSFPPFPSKPLFPLWISGNIQVLFRAALLSEQDRVSLK